MLHDIDVQKFFAKNACKFATFDTNMALPVSLWLQSKSNLPRLLSSDGWRCIISRFIQTFQVPSLKQRSTLLTPNEDEESDIQRHTPVMVHEVVQLLSEQSMKHRNEVPSKILDFTFGSGGHTKAILQAFPQAHVYAVDRDPVSISIAQQLTTNNDEFRGRITPVHCKFSNIADCIGIDKQANYFDAVILDAGCSSMQFDDHQRGFSLSKDAPLDMRMGGASEPNSLTAADIVNKLDERALAQVLKSYGEERMSKKIARHIVEYRSVSNGIKSTVELANVISGVKCGFGLDRAAAVAAGDNTKLAFSGPANKGSGKRDRLGRFQHPATLTFMALRILVNDELNELDFAMHYAYHALKQLGVMTVLTFHSLEDTIVKNHFSSADFDGNIFYSQQQQQSTTSETNDDENERFDRPKDRRRTRGENVIDLSYRSGTKAVSSEAMDTFKTNRWTKVNKHVLLPLFEEIEHNPRSRSAKLRAAVKLESKA